MKYNKDQFKVSYLGATNRQNDVLLSDTLHQLTLANADETYCLIKCEMALKGNMGWQLFYK